MSKLFSGLGDNTGAVLAGGGMAALLALGAYIGFGRDGEVIVEATNVTEQVATQQTEPEVAEKPDVTEEQPDVATPSFDALRREQDGTTIIAGRAEPLSDVEILVDGEQVATATADSTGGFAAIASLPAQETPQVLTLSARSGEDVSTSLDEIILAPAEAANATASEAQSVAQTVSPEPAEPTVEPAPEAPPQPARVAVLKSDEQGVSLLSPDATEIMTAIALDTIGYSELGEVQLSGRAQADTAKVRVYLDNRSVISLPVGADGRWRGDLPGIDEGVYTLRVDEVSASGAVSSRVETPFKRESAEVLAQANSNSDSPIKSITVQAGATLWAIARDRYGDGTLFVRVFEANADSIRDPDLIYPGQVFDLPN